MLSRVNQKLVGIIIVSVVAFGTLRFLIENIGMLEGDWTGLIMVAPLLIGSCTLFLKGRPIYPLYLGASVPLAVASSCVGFILMLQNVSEANEIQTAAGLALTTLFWGGLFSSLGFIFSLSHDAEHEDSAIDKKLLAIMASIPIVFVLFSTFSAGSPILFYLPDPLFLVVAPALVVIGASKLRNRTAEIHVLLQLVIIGTLGAVVIALIKYLIALDLEDNKFAVAEAVAEGILGLFYGSIILTVAAFCSHEGVFKKISFLRLNWHLLEIYALWILMIFAPLTVREFFLTTL